MADLEGKIADFLHDRQELLQCAGGQGHWQADSMEFDILETGERTVIIVIRFIEVMMDPDGQVDRCARMRLELDEFGEIVAARVC
ncbi:hypothetical protein [Thiolapillus brandeum]|uniref:Nuclear transport factor 2 family protein n=1 Tax=Thiolapillus brandeum TaxID=1076588 RepID=A0A7U6GLD9_9GAMM|nr:hypothetical protein [Thiolapillus brandeum]BAO45738.1 hypothetical protein TBH_C2837 [Thiolapillus brandeum]